MTNAVHYVTIISEHYISVERHHSTQFLSVRITLKRAEPLIIFRQRHGNFQCFKLPINSGENGYVD